MIVDVYRNFITCAKNKQIIAIRSEDVRVAKKNLERLQALYEAGSIDQSQVLQIEVDLAQKELQYEQAKNDYKRSTTQLTALIGLDPTLEFEVDLGELDQKVDTSKIIEFRRSIGTVNSAFNNAIENRSDLLAADQQIQVAKSGVKQAFSSYLPQLGTYFNWNWSDRELQNLTNGRYSYGLNLSVPIFNNFARNTQMQNAKLGLKQQEINKDRVLQQIKTNIQTAYLNLQASEDQIRLSNKSLELSQKNYDIAKKRFDLGASQITDFLLADQQLITSKINNVNSIYTYYQSQKELLWAMGKLEE